MITAVSAAYWGWSPAVHSPLESRLPDRCETSADAVLRCSRVVTPQGTRSAAVVVQRGVIVGVEAPDVVVRTRLDVTFPDQMVILPGLVDTHVHLQDPGPQRWEGFDTGSRAAAAGGVTTVVDMPLDSTPVTLDVSALDRKRATARGRVHVDIAFWAGVTPANLDALRPLWEAGVVGFKAYLIDSGHPEFAPLDGDQLRTAMARTARLGAVLAVHAEDGGRRPIRGGAATVRRYATFLGTEPAAVEESAVEAVIAAAWATAAATGASATGTSAAGTPPRVHVVHVSSARSAELVAAARGAGLLITAETCPHYLALCADDVPDGATQVKVCPPVRDAENRDALWGQLASGALSMVVSDHSPFDPVLKHTADGDFARAAGGIVSLQLGLPVVWTCARARGLTLDDVARWMASAPAALVGLGRAGAGKGSIAVGNDADLCILEPEATFVVDPELLWHRQRVTPYDGRELFGVVRETWLRGERIAVDAPRGELLAPAPNRSSQTP